LVIIYLGIIYDLIFVIWNFSCDPNLRPVNRIPLA
jgi:hypothetical protein